MKLEKRGENFKKDNGRGKETKRGEGRDREMVGQ
jgi:hypothetical protein